MKREALEALSGVIMAIRAVETAVQDGRTAPSHDDPVLHAYDLRLARPPRPERAIRALRYLGWRKPLWFDAGVWLPDTLDRLGELYRHRTGERLSQDELARYVVGVHNYFRLKRGEVSKCKLIKRE